MGVKNLPPRCVKKIINSDKVPKRILSKAKREKMKREHLNELFLILLNSLEIGEQTSGKDFILGETIRVVKVMLDEINRLKEENATLLSESQYVTYEKNELKDETCALEIQIHQLKSVIQLSLDLNVTPI